MRATGRDVGAAMHYGNRVVSFRTTDASIARFVPHNREDEEQDEEPGLYRGNSLTQHNAKVDRLYTLRDINRFNRKRPDATGRRP
jgi:hypothetical protein